MPKPESCTLKYVADARMKVRLVSCIRWQILVQKYRNILVQNDILQLRKKKENKIKERSSKYITCAICLNDIRTIFKDFNKGSSINPEVSLYQFLK